jgi:heme-degrading monooxygenase HmoA
MKQIIFTVIALLSVAPTIKTQQMNNTNNSVFIDKIIVPASNRTDFVTRMQSTQQFLHALPGFIAQTTYERTDADGNSVFLTATTWQDKAAIDNAQEALAAEYKRTGFDRAAYNKKMNIKREGGELYQIISSASSPADPTH